MGKVRMGSDGALQIFTDLSALVDLGSASTALGLLANEASMNLVDIQVHG